MLEAIAGKLPDSETQKKLYDLTSDMMQTLVSTQNVSREQAERIKTLEHIQKSNDQSVESNARATANLFGELFSLFMPNYQTNDAASNDFVEALKSSPKAMDFLKPIEVCASAIKQQSITLQQQSMNAELVASRERVKMLQNQLGAYNRMGGAPIATPTSNQSLEPLTTNNIWNAPVTHMPLGAMPATQPAATHTPLPISTAPAPVPIQVAASAHNTAPPQSSNAVNLPDILLKNMNSYSRSALSAQRVMPGDFDGPLMQKNAR
jgi:hypothetical protein